MHHRFSLHYTLQNIIDQTLESQEILLLPQWLPIVIWITYIIIWYSLSINSNVYYYILSASSFVWYDDLSKVHIFLFFSYHFTSLDDDILFRMCVCTTPRKKGNKIGRTLIIMFVFLCVSPVFIVCTHIFVRSCEKEKTGVWSIFYHVLLGKNEQCS